MSSLKIDFRMALALTIAGVLALTSADAFAESCSSSHSDTKAAGARSGNDIVDTAVAAGDFQTLVKAVQAAGLVDALKGDGPFTVFAPTDEAFAQLPKQTLSDLLKPENRDQLAAILTYHVVPGRVTAEAAIGLDSGPTLNGQRVDLVFENGQLTVDGANVIAADIETSNGIIHVIDTVILPSQNDILETAVEAGSFDTLAAAIEAAGLVETLQGEGPFTVFAPTDEAFAALGEGAIADLLKPENREKLTSILTYHVVSGRVYADQALAAGQAKTLQGGTVTIAVDGGRAKVNDASLVATDIEATNGVIHVIDQVLLPDMEVGSADAVRDIIRTAINYGAPMFNHGQVSACVAVYDVAASSLLSLGGDALTAVDRDVLEEALDRAEGTHSSRRQAWILRDALDEVLESKGMMDAAMR